MIFPVIAGFTGGILIIMQSALMVWTGLGRGKHQVAIGTGDVLEFEMRVRTHGNLAENAAIFIVSLALLELSAMNPLVLLGLAVVFIAARVAHIFGMGFIEPSANKPRVLGTITTAATSMLTGCLLVWQVVSGVVAG
jgi:uncharacterized membrane protein YecN with MAPEG domain